LPLLRLSLLPLLLAAALRADSAGSADGFRLEDLLPNAFQKSPRIDLSVITELTAEGRKLTPARPDRPAYYFGVDGGLDQGGPVLPDQPPPDRAYFRKLMAQALAKAGYLPADAAHPASLFVVFKWGTINQVSGDLDPDGNASASPDKFQTQLILQRAEIVGGAPFAESLARAMMEGPVALERLHTSEPRLYEQAMSDLYYVAAFALDLQAAAGGQRKLLWWTRMCTSSSGLSMDETLPVLLTAGEGYFGQAMKRAEVLTVRMNQGKVTVGPIEVKGYVPAAK
jgi:hypothetical protein